MVWNWRLFGLTENLFKSVETHFATNTLGTTGGGKAFQNVEVIESATAVTMTAQNFAGRIQFLGRGLDVTTVNVGGGQAMDAITSGRITQIRFFHNYALEEAANQGFRDTTALQLPRFLVRDAVIDVDFAARQMTNAIVATFRQDSLAPLQAFFNSDGHVVVGQPNASGGVNNIIGFARNDVLIGGAGNDNIRGGAGNDVLNGGPGSDGLAGEAGADLYLPGNSTFAQTGVGDGVTDDGPLGQIDTLSYANSPGPVGIDLNIFDGDQSFGWARGLLAGGIERIVGSAFDDLISGSDNPERIGDTAADIILGGAGDDRIFGFGGADIIDGGPGIDRINGGGLDRFGNGDSGDIVAYDGVALAQIDLFRTGASTFVVAPGHGIDELVEVEFLRLANGIVPLASIAPSTANIQLGTTGASRMTGTNGRDLFFGNDGADRIAVGDGNDRAEGNDEGDRLFGGSGDDRLDGNRGNDAVNGEAGADLLFGGDGADRLAGGGGRDRINGGAGKDRVDGGGGADRVSGGGGNDRLNGQAGADRIEGDRGNDKMKGGGGPDAFVFERRDQVDRIQDFQNNRDTLALDDGLWRGKLNKREVLREFGEMKAGDAVLDFGADRIIIEDMRLNRLLDDLQII